MATKKKSKKKVKKADGRKRAMSSLAKKKKKVKTLPAHEDMDQKGMSEDLSHSDIAVDEMNEQREAKAKTEDDSREEGMGRDE